MPLSLALTAVFLLPIMPELGGVKLNGLFEALCVVGLFPLVVIAGAHSGSQGRASAFVRLAGRLSYPLYITHFPFLYVYMNYVLVTKPSPQAIALAGIGAVAMTLVVAWLALRLWDGPTRAWLRRRLAV